MARGWGGRETGGGARLGAWARGRGRIRGRLACLIWTKRPRARRIDESAVTEDCGEGELKNVAAEGAVSGGLGGGEDACSS